MDVLKELFLEDPLAVYIVLGGVSLILLAMRFKVPSGRLLLWACAPLAAAAVVFLLDLAVTTDRERLREALADLRSAVAHSDRAKLNALIDESYSDPFIGNRDRLTATIDATLRRHKIANVSVSGLKMVIDGDKATTLFTSRIEYEPRGGEPGFIYIEWSIDWVLRDEGWKIGKAVPISPTLVLDAIRGRLDFSRLPAR